jgi:DNA (cytosine-5)-methyltransferase 1
MNCVELFAGAGGAALGLGAAGFSHLACIENDPDACEALRSADLPCVEGDVRDPDLYESEWVGETLLWSSFPCKAWSTSGVREGARDPRGGDMWQATVDAIDCLEPEWFAAENVVGLTQHKGDCWGGCLGPENCARAYFDRVILAQLKERFPSVQHRVLNASSFGVPQHRRRIIIVAGPKAVDWPEPTHGKPSKQDDLFGRDLLPWVSAGEVLGLDGILHTGGEDYRYRPDRKDRERPAPTSEPGPTVGSRGNTIITTSCGERRRLTVAECARLMGFPANHPFHGNLTRQHQQVGNAVPPKLAEVVGRAILGAAR